jgi:NAD(P)-dependent dehydrogenase (short-subunit alcohol dehydrogenase family)
MASKILLVLGAGSNIGRGVADRFLAAGYRVALVSRSAPASSGSDSTLHLQADLKDPSSVPGIFDAVKARFGAAPTVVVYNAAALTPPADTSNIFSVPVEDLDKDLAIANTSPYVAAGLAYKGFEEAANDAPKAFIYTGNVLAAVTRPAPFVVTLGIGKSAASYWIGAASALYKDKGYR